MTGSEKLGLAVGLTDGLVVGGTEKVGVPLGTMLGMPVG